MRSELKEQLLLALAINNIFLLSVVFVPLEKVIGFGIEVKVFCVLASFASSLYIVAIVPKEKNTRLENLAFYLSAVPFIIVFISVLIFSLYK